MNAVQEFPHDSTIWRIESESRPGQHHIVELLAYEAFGACTCEHFEYRIKPDLKEGFPVKPCMHITAAKLELADLVLEKILGNVVKENSRIGPAKSIGTANPNPNPRR